MNQWSPPGRPEPVPVPTDVRTAGQLWWGVVALGVLRLITGAVDRFAGRRDLAKELYDQVRAQQPEATLAQVDLIVSVMQVLIVVFGLALAVGALAVVHQLRRGRLWARTLLDVAAAVLVFGAIGTMIELGGRGGVVPLVTGAAAILQAVMAGGALFLCRRSESDAFFRLNGR
ncbi:hypothetical protein BJY24_003275 [Nocardia transvalensis]|uniref:DUF2127 domain-containing protein n=1 Tax=Nocardia transvalensis TaxID=37333 RepID=A0A7W9PEY6_9NOCA|nr:hypothetical protein [Nocardia transvalensis]MBB5914408.1 hypothetical protein [Nocardia transvalensis]